MSLAIAREDAVRLRRFMTADQNKSNNRKEKSGSDDDEMDIHRGVNSFKMASIAIGSVWGFFMTDLPVY